MQELIQETKTEAPLSFEEICPDFNLLIAEYGWDGVRGKNRYSVGGKERAISNGMNCVVGEAFGD